MANTQCHPLVGMGGEYPNIAVYLANRPPLPEFAALNSYRPLVLGEIKHIADQTGNHWRKIFNVYAKLAYGLDNQGFSCWQTLRDQWLLQNQSDYALLFSPPDFSQKIIHVVAGKQHAQACGLAKKVCWLSDSFAVNEKLRLVVCPYFDYRQLSNIKIEKLVECIESLLKAKSPQW